MSEKYLTIKEVMTKLQIGKSSIYRRVADGTLPTPIQIGHLRRFKQSEINDALAALASQRSNSKGNLGGNQ